MGVTAVTISIAAYSIWVFFTPIRTAMVCLPALASVGRSRRLFTTRIPIAIAPIGTEVASANAVKSRVCT